MTPTMEQVDAEIREIWPFVQNLSDELQRLIERVDKLESKEDRED